MIESIKDVTKYLFNCDFFSDDFDPEDHEEHQIKAEELMRSYKWEDIIQEWTDYLYKNCHTPEEVINFASLFFYYGGADNYVPEPYKFIGYLLYRVDYQKYWEEAGDLIDSIAIEVLEYQGLISLMNDPYYSPFKDPNILNEVDHWKKTDSE